MRIFYSRSKELFLNNRIIKAASWVSLGFFVSQTLRFGGNLIMTRLLMPEYFGIMALSQTFLYILNMISDIGIASNVIRSERGNDSIFLNTAWTAQIIRGGLITLLSIGGAFFLGYMQQSGALNTEAALGSHQLPSIIAVTSLTALISGFKSTNVFLANRNMILGRITIVEVISQAVGLITMVVWAFYERSVWALAGGSLVTAISFVMLSHTHVPGIRNRFCFERESLDEIISFGKWILLSSIVTALLNQGDRLILGTLIDASTLGVYSVALFISTAILQALMKLNSMIFFPKLSEICREDRQDLSKVYYKIRFVTDGVAMGFSGFLVASGAVIISLLYDDRYSSAGYLLQVLALALLFTGPSISSAAYFALGKPKYVTFLVTIEAVVKLSSTIILFSFGGIDLAVWGISLFTLGILPLDFYFKKQTGILNIKKEFRALPFFPLGYLLGLIFVWVGAD